jgi:hypothetical protein
MPDEQHPITEHPAPRPMPGAGMVSPLVPGLSVLGVEGMIGAVCDPNDPESCEIPPEMLAEFLGLPGQTSTAADA